MNPSTASGRLVKDILYSLVVKTGQNSCYKCGKDMCRATFSVEHKTPWLDSEDPVGLFFELDNISFSHIACNVASARRKAALCGTNSAYIAGCRCDSCTVAHAQYQKPNYSKVTRADKYRRLGT
jgi:hypothetical protein